MEFRILGPLEVLSDHGVVTLGGRKPRAVLAVLLLHANEPVSPERLARALWGEDAPAGTVRTVQVHVSRLRKALEDSGIVTTTPAGYRLRVLPGELDAERFELLVEKGRRTLETGRPQEAAAILREAADIWRGPPLADLAFEPFAQREIERLEEQRLEALELRVEADAAAGRHAELVSELRHLVAEHPTRERLAGQLMVALYRCGRQSEALDAYRELHRRLGEEIGVEPGPELRGLQAAVLRHDPALDLERAEELPHELEAAATAALAGRDAELEWLRQRWDEAASGRHRLIVLAGARGMGKTRLAAELALEVHRTGAAVRYAAGDAPAQAALETLASANRAKRRLLVVVDDADRASTEVLAAAGELSSDGALILMTATNPEALADLGPDGVLYLKRLGSQGIGTIAALYAPDQAAEDVPVEWLLGATGGVPRRVHDVASQWARREATKRVSAVVGRAAAGRAELRSMEAELAGGVVQLQTARERVEPAGDDGERVVCPFKGLASFEAADAPYFFGRERLVAELVARLVGAPLLGVVGPSGSGKSSVVRAGLLPALAGGVLPGSDDWPQVLIRPGEHPARELHDAIDGIHAPRFVLAIDQFEETFTVCRDEEERSRFISELVRASRPESGAVAVVALRADFYGRCAEYPALSRLLAANHVLVGAMRHAELQRAIVGPAQRAGLHVEPELVDALVNDIEDEPGALPLLSTALLELWQRREARRLRLATYEEIGGVRKAVARLAESGFGRLDATQQALARTVLLRLAEVEPEGSVERRRLPLEELHGGRADAASVIRLLADARLVTVSAGTVEFTHEALLREWPRLRQWIEDDREDLKIHRSLSAAQEEWIRLGKDEGVLFRGAQLEEAREWAERGDPGPTPAERRFLDASIDWERRDQRAHRRNLAIAFGSLALGLVILAAIAIVAMNERNDAERQRNVAISRELALESANALEADPELALRLALWAYDTSQTDQAAAALRESTLAFRQVAVMRADSLDANAAAFSPDGSRMISGGSDGRVLVWDVAGRREVGRLEAGHGAVLAARYAPDGESIAIGFEDGTLMLTDASLGADRVVLDGDAAVEDVELSHDGRRVAAGLEDGTVEVLAADDSEPPRSLTGHAGPVHAVDISADGRRVASAGEDGTVRTWHLDGGSASQVLHDGGKPERDLAFSPDGDRILAVGDDGQIRVWRTQSGAELRTVSGGGRQLNAASFSADGRRFAAGGRDGVTRVWSVAGGPPVAVLRGQTARVYDVGFGPAGEQVLSAGDDGTVRIWDAGRTQTFKVPSLTYGVDLNRDGRRIASASDDGTVRVWDTATGRLLDDLPGPGGFMTAKFSPAADTLAIASNGARDVRLWSLSGESAETVVELPPGSTSMSARFDPSGRRIVYSDTKAAIVVRDLESGREVALRGGLNPVYDAHFSPDGARVAAIGEKPQVQIWRVDRPGGPEQVLEGHRGNIATLDFSRDGRVATAGADHTVRVTDPSDESAVVLQGHTDEVHTATFTPDGTRVLSAAPDGTLRLWDSRTGVLLAVLQSGQELYDVAVSSDGTIATLGLGEIVRVFKCEVCGSLDQVRALAASRGPRPLTAEERRVFLAAAE